MKFTDTVIVLIITLKNTLHKTCGHRKLLFRFKNLIIPELKFNNVTTVNFVRAMKTLNDCRNYKFY